MRKFLLRQKLPFVQYFITCLRIVMKQQKLLYLSFDSKFHHIFPGTVPPSSFAICQFFTAVLRIVNQEVYT